METVKAPHGPFDPSGPWKQEFAIWSEKSNSRMGWFTLQKQPAADGAFDLEADWRLNQQTKDCQHVRASVNCASNDLATPRSWHIEYMTQLLSGAPIHDLTMKEDAKVNNGVIELASGRRRFAGKPLKDWTCNWSLIDAVQRLGGQQIKPLNFSVLDFLDTRKDDQTLSYMGTQDVILMGRPCQLQGYQLIGYGFLPWEYWLDEQHRLILARTSIYGLLAVETELK